MSANILTNAVSIRLSKTLPPRLRVGGVVPFTATDYPGKLAAVVFVQGCPWRCGYCHNPHLQSRDGDSLIAWDDVMALLRRRVGLIDAVVFSGGEPTIDPALGGAIEDVRQLGFAIGLHTACIYPDHLARVLPLVDWVGFDVKAPFEDYEKITGIGNSGNKARACVELIMANGVEHECRTTAHPALLSESEILALAADMAQQGVQSYALQLVRARGCTDPRLVGAVPAQYPGGDTLQQLGAMFPRFTLRRADA
jgi:anaerobic ribonucleoside-triphosphate reductase activating protein